MERLSFPMEFQLCSPCGIPVYVHFFLIAFFVWQLSNQEAAAKRPGGLPDYHQAALIALSCTVGFVVLFTTVLIHELGHCAGAKLVGGRVERILLWPLGGLAFCSAGAGPKGDLLVALAGPLTHGPQYLAWLGFLELSVRSEDQLGPWAGLVQGVCRSALELQIALVVFNLLVPVYPLDCSQALIALCRLCGASARTAARVMVTLSLLCIAVLVGSMLGALRLPLLSMRGSAFNVALVAWPLGETLRAVRRCNWQVEKFTKQNG
ncbi:unnamed protein product [Effrenium voratum]|nr:unnamed protein product [Effrenium voratum]